MNWEISQWTTADVASLLCLKRLRRRDLLPRGNARPLTQHTIRAMADRFRNALHVNTYRYRMPTYLKTESRWTTASHWEATCQIPLRKRSSRRAVYEDLPFDIVI